jgi:hypothetical protein
MPLTPLPTPPITWPVAPMAPVRTAEAPESPPWWVVGGIEGDGGVLRRTEEDGGRRGAGLCQGRGSYGVACLSLLRHGQSHAT